MKKTIICVLLFGCMPIWSSQAQQTIGPAEVQQAENQLTQVYQQLRGTLDEANQKKLKASEVQWIKQKESAIASSPNADAIHYQLVMQRVATLQEVMRRLVQQSSQGTQSPRSASVSKSQSGEIVQNNPLKGVGQGGNDAQEWSYDFVDTGDDSAKNVKLASDSKSTRILANDLWIVTSDTIPSGDGVGKVGLSFYDTKTLLLKFRLSVPNGVSNVDWSPERKQFIVQTDKVFKWPLGEAPALLLVEPEKKELEIIYFWKTVDWGGSGSGKEGLDILKWDGNKINIPVYVGEAPKAQQRPDGTYGQIGGCLYRQGTVIKPQKPCFTDVSVHITAPVSEISAKASIENKSTAALDYLGINLKPSTLRSDYRKLVKKPTINQAEIGDVYGVHSAGIHILRSIDDGFISDINLSDLTISLHPIPLPNVQQLDQGGYEYSVLNIGLYTNGVIHANDHKKLLLIRNEKTKEIDISNSSIAFSDDAAFYAKYNPQKFTPISISKISSDGRITQGVNSFDGTKIKGVADEFNGFVIYPDRNSFSLSSFEFWNEYSWLDGHKLSDQQEQSARPCYHPTYGPAPEGWEVSSILTGAGAGFSNYEVRVRNLKSKRSYKIASNHDCGRLPVVMVTNSPTTAQVLYCGDGQANLASLDLTTGAVSQLQQWHWVKTPDSNGGALYDQKKQFLFVPEPGGYGVYAPFSTAASAKIFDLFLEGHDQFVVLLPNGIYAGTPGCDSLLKLQVGDGKVGATSVAPWKNRPAEVIKALGGDPKTADLLGKVTERWLKRIGFDPSTPEPAASEISKVSVSQMPPLWAPSPQVSFPIEATAGGEPLKEVTVRVNGVLQKSFSGSELNVPTRGHVTLNASVTLAEGQNWIEVSANDAKGRPGNLEHFRTILPKASETPKRYIVAMGCSEYDRPELNLQYAAKDAGDVLKTFQEAGGRECKTLLLTNKEVGPEALEKIKAFVAGSKESDEVILFCAGHGMLDEHYDYVFAGHQIDPEHSGETGIHLDALLDAIKAGKSLKRLVLMDTCQSGTVGEKEEMKLAEASTELPHGVRAVKSRALKVVGVSPMTGGDQQRFIEEMFLLPGQHRGINIIGASGGAEYAIESDKWNNGVFTSALIEALRDQKADMDHRGRISVSDLKTYLGQRVPELTGGAQKPSVVAFEQDQDFDLVGKMPPIPESVKNNTGATSSEAPAQSASSATAGESSSMAQTNLGPQFVNSLGQRFVPIPGTPTYFCIWSTRVSDYGQFVKETGRAWKPAGFPQKPDHPAVRISYQDATAFCEWLTQKEHAMGKLPANLEYRLPKDLEWSAAAGITAKEVDGPPAWRSGSIPNCYAWGSSWPPPKGSGNYDPKMKTDSFPNTSPVGSFAPNRFGLFDINGNAYQWMHDDFDESGQGCLRGGSWADEEEESINLSNRFPAAKDSQGKCYGFRCVIAPIHQ